MREGQRSIIVGRLMPIGILAEVFLGAPPLFVLVGDVSMLAGAVWMGLAVARLHLTPASASVANS